MVKNIITFGPNNHSVKQTKVFSPPWEEESSANLINDNLLQIP